MQNKFIVEMYGKSKPNPQWLYAIKAVNGVLVAICHKKYHNRALCRNVAKNLSEALKCPFYEYKGDAIAVNVKGRGQNTLDTKYNLIPTEKESKCEKKS